MTIAFPKAVAPLQVWFVDKLRVLNFNEFIAELLIWPSQPYKTGDLDFMTHLDPWLQTLSSKTFLVFSFWQEFYCLQGNLRSDFVFSRRNETSENSPEICKLFRSYSISRLVSARLRQFKTVKNPKYLTLNEPYWTYSNTVQVATSMNKAGRLCSVYSTCLPTSHSLYRGLIWRKKCQRHFYEAFACLFSYLPLLCTFRIKLSCNGLDRIRLLEKHGQKHSSTHA